MNRNYTGFVNTLGIILSIGNFLFHRIFEKKIYWMRLKTLETLFLGEHIEILLIVRVK